MSRRGISDDEEDDEEEVYEEEEEEQKIQDTNPRETDKVDSEPSKPQREHEREKVGNIDRLVFLKEYARDTNRKYTNVATKLGIAHSSAYNYVQSYIYLVVQTQKDPDFPRKVRIVLNRNIPKKYHITDEEIIALRPLGNLWRYRKCSAL